MVGYYIYLYNRVLLIAYLHGMMQISKMHVEEMPYFDETEILDLVILARYSVLTYEWYQAEHLMINVEPNCGGAKLRGQQF